MNSSTIKIVSWSTMLVLASLVFLGLTSKTRNQINDLEININSEQGDSLTLIDDDYVKSMIIRELGIDISLELTMDKKELVQIEETLNEDRFVKMADVYFGQNQSLIMDIQVKEPIARVIDPTGKNFYLTGLGDIIPFSYSYSPRLMVVSGYLPVIGGDNWSEMIDLITAVHKNRFMRAQIESIHWMEDQKVVLIPKLGEFKILFGKVSNVEAKIKKLESFYKESYDKIDWSKYGEVVLDYENQIILKEKVNRA